MYCRSCNKVLPDRSVFCPYCGSNQETSVTCPVCKARMAPYAQYCLRCGHKVSDKDSGSGMGFAAPKITGEPFYRKWIAEHKQLAETKRITWISEFNGPYAVAVDDSAPGKAIRPFLVKGEDKAEIICYMNWTGANVANGVLAGDGDCFRNGTKFLSFILFRSNSMVSSEEYRNILKAFTNISEPYATSGIALLVSRTGMILFAAQYQENLTGIADIFPLRVIGRKYCLYTAPYEYDAMTNRERYNAATDEMKIAAQMIIDCETGKKVAGDVFVPKYDGDPSEYFVEFFGYSDDLADRTLRNSTEKERTRRIFNRKTGKIYEPDGETIYKTVNICGHKERSRYLLLRISEIHTTEDGLGRTHSGRFDLIDENDITVMSLGRHDLRYDAEIVEAGGRIYISTHSPEVVDKKGELNCVNRITNIYCFEIEQGGSYTRKAAGRLKNGGGFTDGVVRIHKADRTDSCYGAFVLDGKTYISLIKERDDPADEYDKCALLDDGLRTIYSFNYKQYYGTQAPYGIHVFDGVIYALSGEEDDLCESKAVLTNIATAETVFSVPAGSLISNANTEFGRSRLTPKYEFGSYRIGGEPYFLIGKQNRGLGIMDMHGRTVIPPDSDNFFIVSGESLGMIGENGKYARLPADTFLIVLGGYDSDRYRVCGADGSTVFEGNMAQLTEKFA